MDKIRVFEAFSGYGSQQLALKRLKSDFPDFDYEVVGISEIDKYAIDAYNALHPNITNYGDISKIDWAQVPDFDLFTYSFPCTDISVSGRMDGFEEGSGTRSSLLWECRRAIEEKRPKYLLLENVANIVSTKFLPLFNKWIQELIGLGYTSYWQILNAKDYGVPQSRKRVFCISILNGGGYEFPKPFPLNKRIKDILEPSVPESYYISEERMKNFRPRGTKHRGVETCIEQIGNLYPDTATFKNRTMGRVYSIEGLAPTINCCGGGDREPKILVVGNLYPHGQDGIVVDADGISPTHTAGHANCPKNLRAGRIRKLTPREVFRLMDLEDSDIDCLQSLSLSNAQQYKLAGNSICVGVLYHIFRNMFVDVGDYTQEMKLF